MQPRWARRVSNSRVAIIKCKCRDVYPPGALRRSDHTISAANTISGQYPVATMSRGADSITDVRYLPFETLPILNENSDYGCRPLNNIIRRRR